MKISTVELRYSELHFLAIFSDELFSNLHPETIVCGKVRV